MNPIRALRDTFSSDPAYHARRDAERASDLALKAQAITVDLMGEPTDDVICSTRHGQMRIDAVDFLEMVALFAHKARRIADEENW